MKKNKNVGCKRDSMERPLVCVCVCVYNFWNFDNGFLVRVEFKFMKFRCMLHVNFVKTLIVTLSKEIDKNK